MSFASFSFGKPPTERRAHYYMVAAAIEPIGRGLLRDEDISRSRAREEIYEYEKQRYDLWLRRYLLACQTHNVIPAEAGIHDTSQSGCGNLRGCRPPPA